MVFNPGIVIGFTALLVALQAARVGLYRAYPELRLINNHVAEDGIARCVNRNRGVIWCRVVIGGISSALYLGALAPFEAAMSATVLSATMLLGALGVGIATGAGPYVLMYRSVGNMLRGRIREAGVLVCLGCGYDLRGQTDARCPECGEPFDPALLEQATQAGEEAKPS